MNGAWTPGEAVAEAVLKGAGTTLRHYMPQSKVEIIKAADDAVEPLIEALKPFAAGGDWGKWLAWIVAGAPDRESGVAAAKALVKMRAKVDAALAGAAPPSRDGGR